MVGSPLYQGLVGQERAVANLAAAARSPVHAYLFVGPVGTGTRDAARAFAADVLCPAGGCAACTSCRNALIERHPDLLVIERSGASIRASEIDEVIRLAVRPPSEGRFKVIVLVDFHLVDQQYPRLLKTLEEPPASTVFVVLAEHVPPELVTIASRCVRIEFALLSPEAIGSALVAEGAEPALAAEVAESAGGNLGRARLLVGDPGHAARRLLWRSVPTRLDGTGATIATLADELLASVGTVLGPLVARQQAETASAGGGAKAGKELDERHRREQRRARTDELRFGMAALAGAYRDRLVAGLGGPAQAGAVVAAIAALDAAGQALVRNPNETLLVQGLLVALTDAGSR